MVTVQVVDTRLKGAGVIKEAEGHVGKGVQGDKRNGWWGGGQNIV